MNDNVEIHGSSFLRTRANAQSLKPTPASCTDAGNGRRLPLSACEQHVARRNSRRNDCLLLTPRLNCRSYMSRASHDGKKSRGKPQVFLWSPSALFPDNRCEAPIQGSNGPPPAQGASPARRLRIGAQRLFTAGHRPAVIGRNSPIPTMDIVKESLCQMLMRAYQ